MLNTVAIINVIEISEGFYEHIKDRELHKDIRR